MASLTKNTINKKRSLSENDIDQQGPAKKVSFAKPKEEEKVKEQSSRIIIIIDETGSMHGRKSATISGIREFVDSQLNADKIDGELEPKLTFVFFNTKSRTFTWDKLSQVKDTSITNNLDTVLSSYNPDNCTALYDTIDNVTKEFEHEKYNIVAIFTDGQDNSSRATATNIKDKIKKMQDDLHWQFHFLTIGLEQWQANDIGQNMGLQTQAVDNTLDVADQMDNLMRSVSQNITSSRGISTQLRRTHNNHNSNPQ